MSRPTRRALFKALATAVVPPVAAPDSALRPPGRHLAFGADPSRQVVISWQELGPVNRPYVRVATAGGQFGPPIAAESRRLDSELKWQKPEHSFPPHAPAKMSQHY